MNTAPHSARLWEESQLRKASKKMRFACRLLVPGLPPGRLEDMVHILLDCAREVEEVQLALAPEN